MGKKLSSCKNPKFVEIIEKIEKCCSKYEMFCDLADNDLTLENNLKAIGEINQKDSLRKISPVTKCCIPYQLPCGHKMGTKYFLRVAQELKDKAKEGPIQFRCPFECKHVLSERDLFALLGSQFKSITSNYEKYSDICMFCGAKPREKLILIHYHHFLCSSCLYSLIKISTEGQMIIIDRTLVSSSKIFSSDNTPIKCPARNCSYHMDISIIKYIMSERDFSIAYRKALSQVGSSGSMSAVPRYIITCIICSATVDEAEGYEMECHHGYCNKCMGKYLEEQFAKGKGMHGMQCKYNGCKQAFNLYILKQFLGTDRVHKLKERTDKQKSQVFEYQ